MESGRSPVGGSSRRATKSGSGKPKQPQRGLGVAQLEKIRIQSEFMYHPFHSNLTKMGNAESLSSGIRSRDKQSTPAWLSADHGIISSISHLHHGGPVTLPLMEDSAGIRTLHHDRSHCEGSSFSRVFGCETSGSQDLDLELRLSL
ncbi:hypothetical protein KSP39_PZI001495 [Platanthera zijinensis]|uniref:Uncharacterized protein n=1 Tax=Platanthera zijinensis TaxID=2320716 RepID=A0AAP0C1A0_9ASPA